MITRLAFIAFLLSSTLLFSHAGHDHSNESPHTYSILRLGPLHFIFIHFPIALVTMTGIAELLNQLKPGQHYDHLASFLLRFALILTIPTLIFGFLLGYGQIYEGAQEQIFEKHQVFGFLSFFLLCLVTYLKKLQKWSFYYVFLVILFLCVIFTASLGGNLAFGTTGFLL